MNILIEILLIGAMVIKPIFDFQPQQLTLLSAYEQSVATVLGYGGARGGSKSHGGRNVTSLRRWKYRDTPGVIIRRTLDDIKDNHIRPLFREHPYLENYYNKQEKIIMLPNKSFIRFIGAEHERDIYKLYGKEFADIFLDQAEQFTQEEIEFLHTVNRCTTNLDITPKMLLTFNPGNVGHTYLKRIFIQREFVDNEDPNDYTFIRAFGWDNVKWVARYLRDQGIPEHKYYSWTDDERFKCFITHSDYGRKLNKLPESQRLAQLFGDFDVFEGQFFDMWRDAIHIIKGEYQIPLGANLISGLDYGQQTVLEVLNQDYEGNVDFFVECYTEHQTPSERANSIADVLLEHKLYKLRMLCDTNMDTDMSEYVEAGRTPFDIFKAVFERRMGQNAPRMELVTKHSTDKRGYRVISNEAFKDGLLIEEKKRPIIKVHQRCQHLIKSITSLLTDKNSDEGLDFIQGANVDDHAYDAGKYAYNEIKKPIAPPKEELPKWFTQKMKENKSKSGWKVGMS